MKSIAEVTGNASLRAAEIGRHLAETKAIRIQQGVERYGWSPDADCANCGDTGVVPGLLPTQYCGCPFGARAEAQQKRARAAAALERVWHHESNVPRRFRGYRLATSPAPEAAKRLVRDWLASDPVETGSNLIVTGSVGIGKTGLAVAALWELCVGGQTRMQFIATSEFFDAQRPGSEEDGVMVACKKASVLVLDDLGATRATEWEKERIFALVNARYEWQRPTVITTNVDMEELAKSLGDRTMSRLLEAHVVVAIDGEDVRLRAVG